MTDRKSPCPCLLLKANGRTQDGGTGAVKAEEEFTAWDDITGEQLDAEEVKKARRDEIAEVHKHEPSGQVGFHMTCYGGQAVLPGPPRGRRGV